MIPSVRLLDYLYMLYIYMIYSLLLQMCEGYSSVPRRKCEDTEFNVRLADVAPLPTGRGAHSIHYSRLVIPSDLAPVPEPVVRTQVLVHIPGRWYLSLHGVPIGRYDPPKRILLRLQDFKLIG